MNYLDRIIDKFIQDSIEPILPHVANKIVEVEVAKNVVDELLAQERLFTVLIIKNISEIHD